MHICKVYGSYRLSAVDHYEVTWCLVLTTCTHSRNTGPTNDIWPIPKNRSQPLNRRRLRFHIPQKDTPRQVRNTTNTLLARSTTNQSTNHNLPDGIYTFAWPGQHTRLIFAAPSPRPIHGPLRARLCLVYLFMFIALMRPLSSSS